MNKFQTEVFLKFLIDENIIKVNINKINSYVVV